MTSKTALARKVASPGMGAEASRMPAVIAAGEIGRGWGSKRRLGTKAASASSRRHASGIPARWRMCLCGMAAFLATGLPPVQISAFAQWDAPLLLPQTTVLRSFASQTRPSTRSGQCVVRTGRVTSRNRAFDLATAKICCKQRPAMQDRSTSIEHQNDDGGQSNARRSRADEPMLLSVHCVAVGTSPTGLAKEICLDQ